MEEVVPLFDERLGSVGELGFVEFFVQIVDFVQVFGVLVGVGYEVLEE